MSAENHPYYSGLRRWIDAQSTYTLSSLAKAAGLDSSTILHAIRKGTAPSQTTIEKIKAVTGLNYEEIVQMGGDLAPVFVPAGAASRSARVRQAPPTGFSDSDVAPWIPKPDDPQRQRVEDMAAYLSEGRGGRDIWRVKSRAMILAGYDDQDLILVDQHATAEAGSVVIAQVYDHDIGSAATLLRRFDPPVLSAASPDPGDWKPHVVDGRNVKIMGVVTASWRTK